MDLGSIPSISKDYRGSLRWLLEMTKPDEPSPRRTAVPACSALDGRTA